MMRVQEAVHDAGGRRYLQPTHFTRGERTCLEKSDSTSIHLGGEFIRRADSPCSQGEPSLWYSF
jgi:hypothetical protein